MINLKPIKQPGLKFDHVVGTGGIGSGIFFLMEGNETLGRNESRPAMLLPYKDFCKQHIILHYISVLLGSDGNGSFQTFPIGKVGNDDIGKELVQKMRSAGMNTDYVGICNDHSTLFSVCYQYPDHSGGNITTQASASNEVTAEDIDVFFRESDLKREGEIIIAAPEVPLAARIRLLEYGRKRGSLNVACLLSSEADEFDRRDGFEMVDILSINMDEAGSIAKVREEGNGSGRIVEACIKVLSEINPGILILITDGANGCYCYAHGLLEFVHSLGAAVKSTAGAGDAFLAGTVAGLACGLPLVKGVGDGYFAETPLQTAVELGVLLASLSVTSADTIHLGANAVLLHEYALKNSIRFGEGFHKIFFDPISITL
ncbi:MAG TPA: PfkB family carbohydrate kinase [Puia sp.]|nr:PfkB family carbohydrate kinase [Puia sp.]